MFPGEYSMVVQADRHFIELAKDFSNLEEVVARLRDHSSLRAMIARAHADLIASGRYSYRQFIRGFDAVVEEMAPPRPSRGKRGYHAARAEATVRRGGMRMREVVGAPAIATTRLGLALLLAFRSPGLRPLLLAYARRRDLRRRVPTARFFVDLLRLGMLATAVRSPRAVGFQVDSMLDVVEGRLVFVSRPSGEKAGEDRGTVADFRALVTRGGLKAVDWDHSAVGSKVHYGRHVFGLAVSVGPDGRHRFSALGDLLGAGLAEAREALFRIAAATCMGIVGDASRVAPATDRDRVATF
jgi:hypothetical protein